MKAWELLGEASAPDGTDIRLTRRDDEYVILANGKPLMSRSSESKRLAAPRILPTPDAASDRLLPSKPEKARRDM